MATDQRLRREIDDLGRMFGETVRSYAGEDIFELVEQIRGLSRRFCDGEYDAADEIDALLRKMTAEQLRLVMRSFGNFLELANLAEDRQRVRALRDREVKNHPAPRAESILSAILTLKDRGLSAEEITSVVERVAIELVFTAHPTEAKRKSIRSKLRELRRLLGELDTAGLTPRDEARLKGEVRNEIVKLWHTDVIKPSRPTVLEEVRRGLSFKPVLYQTVPRILGELREALGEAYPEVAPEIANLLRFGSWIGGDRDGHPYVTPEITEQTLGWLRRAAIERHRAICEGLVETLSLSVRQASQCAELFEPIASACATHPEIADLIEVIPPLEAPRRWLRVISWRLEQTDLSIDEPADLPGAYRNASELCEDVRLLRDSLLGADHDLTLADDAQEWLDQVEVFGLHTARLDIRQHSGIYRGVMEELWRAIGMVQEGQELSEAERQKLLIDTLPIAANIAPIDLSDAAQETLRLFRVLRRSARRYGGDCLGGHVISMTRYPSDLLTVLWLWSWSERVDGGQPEDAELHLPIMPLFETIEDLKNGAAILEDTLKAEAYRKHVAACGDKQTVMIGYSDSTKDGGYLSAAWSLQSVQIRLHEIAESHGIRVTFFHGRGGSLGRGGGPAARSILSLPFETFDGSLRLTEQGEVLAERYDDPAIAHRHLEQVVWAVLIACTTPPPQPTDEWRERMQRMAESSFAAYRELVDIPGFTTFFRLATPISEIEKLPIGSRPSRRKKGGKIEDLRAIPWVFSWTQSRCLLPAWYGLGAGIEAMMESAGSAEELRKMYEQWPFFRATIDNAALALAKANRPVFKRYAELASDGENSAEIIQKLDSEYERSREAILKVTGAGELLDSVPWLQESIRVRNRYVDPLNLIQLEVIRRIRELGEDETPEELRHLSQLSIKAVAAGMRTTG